jgi:hypothetical protein
VIAGRTQHRVTVPPDSPRELVEFVLDLVEQDSRPAYRISARAGLGEGYVSQIAHRQKTDMAFAKAVRLLDVLGWRVVLERKASV